MGNTDPHGWLRSVDGFLVQGIAMPAGPPWPQDFHPVPKRAHWSQSMRDLRDFRWSLVGGLVAFPAGLALGGRATKVDWLVSAMGTEWFVYKGSVVVCVMAGFAIGQALYKDVVRQQPLADQAASSKLSSLQMRHPLFILFSLLIAGGSSSAAADRK